MRNNKTVKLLIPGKIWRTSAKNLISLPKFALYAIALLPGAKNGSNVGMRLNTVAIAVVVANSQFISYKLLVDHRPITLVTSQFLSHYVC
jgi:hypothetical protein